MSCRWIPGYIPAAAQKAWERILDLPISDALEADDFDQTVTVRQIVDDDGTVIREMELLGPDSPAEFVIRVNPVFRDPDNLEASNEAMRQEIIRVVNRIEECGDMRRSMEVLTNGKRTL